MKKKLAILIYSMAAGGAERVVSVLLPELTKHYRVTLVLMNDTVFYDIPEEVELRFLERSQPEEPGVMNLLKLPLLAWRYRRLCRKEGMEISLSFMGRPNYVNLLASMAGSGAGTIISERAMPSLQYGYPGLQSMINRRLIRLLYPVADMVVANSRGNREDLIVNFGVPAGKTVTIYNPFDLEYIREKAQKQPAIQKEGFVFATVGRIDEGKNHRMLIEAFSRLDNDMMNLWIIGDGPLREDLEKVVRQKRLEKKVRFIGRQENPFSWMAQSDCFVFASRHEGFPNVLVEAMACGLPVISTDCPSGPGEILDDRGGSGCLRTGMQETAYGILVAVDDTDSMELAMEKMYNSETLRKIYAGKALERAGMFGKEKTVSEFVRLIEDTVKEKNRKNACAE